MRKKVKLLGIVAVCIIIIITTAIALRPYVQEKRWEFLYQKNLQTVAELNENSYFYGVELLGAPPKDYDKNGKNVLPTTEADSYSCEQYYDVYGVFSIAIYSEDAHVFGIHVGDSYQEAVAILEDNGYEWEEVPPSTAEVKGERFRYVKDHTAIWLRLPSKDSEVVEAISVNVSVIEGKKLAIVE